MDQKDESQPKWRTRLVEGRFPDREFDIEFCNSPRNSSLQYRALARFDAPLQHDGVTPETFAKDSVVYQIGVAPVRIDISTHIDGVTFDTAWRNRVQDSIFGVPHSRPN